MNLATTLAIMVTAAFIAVVAGLLWRSRNGWPPVPQWTWLIIFKLLALAGTIFGAGVLTLLFWHRSDNRADRMDRVIDYLAAGKGGQAMGDIGKLLARGMNLDSHLLVAGVLVIVLSLGWVLTPRKFEFQGPGGFRGAFSGGDEQEQALQDARTEGAAATAQAATDKAVEVATNTGDTP